MINIQFGSHDFTSQGAPCPMCGSEERKSLLVVSESSYSEQQLDMSSCLACGSAYFTNDEPVLGYDHEKFEKDYWFNYVQNGAGISAMLEPLLALEVERKGSLLDVGCGFGFVPHFWQTVFGQDAVGLEASRYGRVGAEKLGVNIIPKYYADALELHGTKFDYVFSSEVIEHVEDPKAFIGEISQALADDGILVLTTPSASALVPESDYLLLLATLSPGFHYFVSSSDALRELLRDCGFEHVRVTDSGARLFAWASHKSLPSVREGFSDWNIYLEYLQSLGENPDPHVSSGALYRALKDSYNLGMHDLADQIFTKFSQIALQYYNIDFRNPRAIVESQRLRENLNNEEYPSWLGCSLLYAGLVERKRGCPFDLEESLLSGSIEVMQKEIELAAQFAGEPAHFIKLAKREHASVIDRFWDSQSTIFDSNQIFILRHPGELAGKDACLFAAYSSQGKLTAAMADYISLLNDNGVSVILCLALDDTTVDLDLSNLAAASGIIIRRNGGYDFSAWSSALRLLPACWSARRLFFANDSVFILPSLLTEFLENMRSLSADFVGITESFLHTHHAQSYFFMLQGGALDHGGLLAYFQKLPCLGTKNDVILAYELTTLEKMKSEFNLSTGILFPMDALFPGANESEFASLTVTHSYWSYLISRGFPFVKVELIRDNPGKNDILHWRYVFQKHGASIYSALEHISVPRSTTLAPSYSANSHGKKSLIDAGVSQKYRSELRHILSDLNHVRLNARRRRKLRREGL